MQKAYNGKRWENYPSENTPLNEKNLNDIHNFCEESDNRIIQLDLTKLDKVSAGGMITGFALDTATGDITLTFYNGSKTVIPTNIAKIALNITWDSQNERLVLHMPDGSKTYVDLSTLITQYEFIESDEIYFEVTADGKVKAHIKDHSIGADKLQPNYLADITVQAQIATQKASDAAAQSSIASMEANRAQTEADRAAQYADIVAPGFYVDIDNMMLYMKAGVGVEFIMADNTLCWKIA